MRKNYILDKKSGLLGAGLFLSLWVSLGVLTGCGATESAASSSGPATPTANYRVTFTSTWSGTTHPDSFPSNPHYSGLIGLTHNSGATLWAPGDISSTGMESMAESGSKTLLTTEINALIANGTGDIILSGGNINPSPGSVSLDFVATSSHPLVSLVCMIAPSPDWFVGVRDFLLVEDNEWVGSKTMSLVAWDAGTDDGTIYTSGDIDTSPKDGISQLTLTPFLVNGSIPYLGTFTFEKL
ncbi:MAG: hypothetical protein ACI9BD_000657 [Candidatus Marinamargulisbacteria bacterium]|jgi:hypothetical protein